MPENGNPTSLMMDRVLAAIAENASNPRVESKLRADLKIKMEALQGAIAYLARFNAISRVAVGGNFYWIKTDFFNRNGQEPGCAKILMGVLHRKHMAAEKQKHDDRETAKNEWVSTNKTAWAEPFIKCPACKKTRGLGDIVQYSRGASEHKTEIGLNALAGSTTCECGLRLYYGLWNIDFGSRWIKDSSLQQAIERFGLLPDEAINAKSANRYFSDIWKRLSGTEGEFKFR